MLSTVMPMTNLSTSTLLHSRHIYIYIIIITRNLTSHCNADINKYR